MRAIKFRAWDGYAETMIHWDELLFPKSKHRSLINLLCSLPQDHKSSLMQFTGLRDKNGVEIYEGDIVDLPHWKPKRWLVDYSNETGAFYFRHKIEQPYDVCHPMRYLEQASVVGNVYEHPELLEAK